MAVVKFNPKTKAKVERPKKTAPIKPEKKTLSITQRAVDNARFGAKQRSNPIHPYILSNHPKEIFPKGATTMAQDDQLTSALNWASGQWSGLSSVITAFDEGLVFPGYPYLAAISQRPEYRRPSEIIATALTRKWIKLQSSHKDDDETEESDKVKGKDTADKIKQINDELDRLQAKSVFKRYIEIDGFFGRSHLYLDCCDPKDREELKTPIGNGRSKISSKKVSPENPLRRIKVIEPVWCYPTQYNSNDPLEPNWYRPDQWYCMGKEIHASRLIPMVTREVPDMLKPAYSFGGVALSQLMKPYVDNWIRTRQSVSDILHNFSTSVLLSDLASLMQGDELLKRMALFNATRDNQGAMILDKETEEFVNVSAPLGGLDHLNAQAQEQMASPCGIPLIILFGIVPTGLNATTDGEIEVWDDWVHSQQENYLRNPLTIVIDFVQLSLFGEVDPDITFSFEPLRSLDELQLAQVRKTDADTDIALINAAVISPAESRKRLASDPDTPYEDLDVDDLPLPPEGDDEDDGEENDDDEPGMSSSGTDGSSKEA